MIHLYMREGDHCNQKKNPTSEGFLNFITFLAIPFPMQQHIYCVFLTFGLG